ncbi:MAG: hypothetical protein RIS52_1900, partial [Pseudomonadota bacterium]
MARLGEVLRMRQVIAVLLAAALAGSAV